METSRWLDDIKPRDGDENSVRSRIVVQQYNVDKRLDVHQGTPPLKVLRMLLALATSKGSHRQKVCGIWDVSVAFFHSPMDEFTVVRPPVGLLPNISENMMARPFVHSLSTSGDVFVQALSPLRPGSEVIEGANGTGSCFRTSQVTP